MVQNGARISLRRDEALHRQLRLAHKPPLQAACERHGVSLRAAALQFPLRHPAVTAIVSGPGSADTVVDVLAQRQVPIPDDLWDELDALVPDQSALG